jgi:NAD-dependent DNA ligase
MRLNTAYFIENKSVASDAVMDALKHELKKLEAQYPDLVTPDSPTQRVGAPLDGRLPKVKHLTQKESLQDAFTHEELEDWIDQMTRALGGEKRSFEICCELKIDGLNITLLYEQSKDDEKILCAPARRDARQRHGRRRRDALDPHHLDLAVVVHRGEGRRVPDGARDRRRSLHAARGRWKR